MGCEKMSKLKFISSIFLFFLAGVLSFVIGLAIAETRPPFEARSEINVPVLIWFAITILSFIKLKVSLGRKIVYAVTSFLGLLVAFFLWLALIAFPAHDVVFLSIHKLDYEPGSYFVLTEDDLNRYPELRKALEMMREKGEESIIYSLPKDRGNEIFGYLNKRQKAALIGNPASYSLYAIRFKYEGEFYGVDLMVT